MKYLWYFLWVLLLGIGFFIWYIYSGLKFIPPHFHANFAMYVDGERIDFSKDKYQEDVAGCSLTGLMYPKDRAHLHENNPDTIHIHHEWVSWGHFFTNNWFVFGEDFLILDDQSVLLQNNEQADNDITYILNGEQVDNPFNTLIKSKDKLLINYGKQSDWEIQELYNSVSTNAGEYNSKYDPWSCGWTNENGLAVLIRDMFSHKH